MKKKSIGQFFSDLCCVTSIKNDLDEEYHVTKKIDKIYEVDTNHILSTDIIKKNNLDELMINKKKKLSKINKILIKRILNLHITCWKLNTKFIKTSSSIIDSIIYNNRVKKIIEQWRLNTEDYIFV